MCSIILKYSQNQGGFNPPPLILVPKIQGPPQPPYFGAPAVMYSRT